MSYVRQRSRQVMRRPRPRKVGLSGLLEQIFGGAAGQAADSIDDASLSACQAQADQDTSTIDARAYDLAQNWNPTGTFTPDEMNAVLDAVLALRQSAFQAVSQAKQIAPSTQQDLLNQMLGNLSGTTPQLLAYNSAVAQAKAAGTYVDAQGLKQWVLDEYTNASSAMHAASVVSCQLPWWAGMLIAVSQAAVALWQAAKAAVGVVLKIGEKAITAVEGAFDLVATVEKIAPYAAVGLAAWWLFLREKKRKTA